MRRKPRTPFAYTLKDGSATFTLHPPTQGEWADIVDESAGNMHTMIELVVRCVERVEGEEAAAFGAANSAERRKYVDEVLAVDTLRELGNAIADSLLSETDRKNSGSPSA